MVLAQDWYQLGMKEYRRLHYAEALVDFNKALELNADYAEAYVNRGLALLLLGKTTAGEQDFDRCLKLNSALKDSLGQRIRKIQQLLERR